MDNHPRENAIELFLRSPQSLEADQRLLIERHLDLCPQCLDSLNLLRSFYAEFDRQIAEDASLKQFADRITNQPAVFELHPYRYTPNPAQFGEHVMTVLAAKSEGHDEYRFSSICTLVSHDERAVVRILKDNETSHYRLYLITDREHQFSEATIKFPLFDRSLVFDSKNHQTEFSLPAAEAVDWTSVVAELRLR
ncbi:MAG TPA: hypothetical protein VI758_00540 [Bacteroidota bacterium]